MKNVKKLPKRPRSIPTRFFKSDRPSHQYGHFLGSDHHLYEVNSFDPCDDSTNQIINLRQVIHLHLTFVAKSDDYSICRPTEKTGALFLMKCGKEIQVNYPTEQIAASEYQYLKKTIAEL